MDQFYKIAGLLVQMDTFGRTEDFARPYLIEGPQTPDIVVEADWTPWKKKSDKISDASCEYLATGSSFYRQLLNFNGMLLHSSALVMDGKAYLFSAPCGTGKSTHVALWRRVFGDDRVRVLNDDKPALRLENGTWYAYGTPWSGKTGQNLNLRAPLAGITMIERGKMNEIEPFSGKAAIRAVLSQTTPVQETELRIKQLGLLDKLMTQVPIWKLKCNMEPEAAIVSYEAMSGEKWRK